LLSKIGVDPVGLGSILDQLISAGIPQDIIVTVSQGYKLNGAIIATERKLAEGSLKHSGCRMMKWCVGNARTELKGSAIYITKAASNQYGKIDPLIALFNAASIMSMTPERKVDVDDWIA